MELDTRIQTQMAATTSWKEAGNRGTIILSTGYGKSYLGVVAAGAQIKKQLIKKVLIVVPTIPLIDQWEKEFIKWGYDLTGVNILCLKTAYKMKADYDLLIIDEIHCALSPEYRAIFENINYSQLMGLTATLPHLDEYKKLLEEVCPVVFTKSMDEAVESGAVSDYILYNLEVTMNKSDRGRYRVFDTNLKRAQMEIGLLKRLTPELRHLVIPVFEIAKKYAVGKHDPSLKEVVKYSKQFWASMSMRKWICYESKSKLDIVRKIVDKFPERKWIIFNKSIKFAESLKDVLAATDHRCGIYHSKMKTDERAQVLRDFEDNKFQYLIAVDALNAGLNIPDIDSAICVAGTSTELTQVQALGQ